MTIVEYIKNIKRPCDCNKGVVWHKIEYITRIRARGHWLNDYAQLLTKRCKYKNEWRYIAECEICNKFYFSTRKKNEMINNLKFLGFGYKEKEGIK